MASTILDYLKNLKDNFIPKMKLSTTEVIFENVKYGDTQFLHLEIENEGDGLLEYEITKIPEKHNMYLKKETNEDDEDSEQQQKKRRVQHSGWLSITPLRGVIKAGEKKQITFRV